MRRIIAALLIALTCSIGLGATHGAGAADPGAEADFANRVNALRASVGRAPLGVHPVLTAKAENWAAYMAGSGCLCHSNLPDGVTVAWTKLGENIGRGPSVASIHDALVHSPLHYANMVDPSFNCIGVGVAYGSGGMYVAEVFMNGAGPAAPAYVPSWKPWGALGGSIASAPASASWGPNRVDVFATDSGGSLVHKWWDGYSWNGWENLGGNLTSAPTVAAWSPNRLDVFGRASNGTLAHKWWDGRAWSAWESLGGGVVGDPAAVSWSGGRLDVFVRGTDNRLYHRWFGGGWAPWESLGGTLTTGPTATSLGAGRLDVFVRGTDNKLYHQWFGGRWIGWESLGGDLSAGPGATSQGPQQLNVFVRGTDRQVWQRAFR